VNNQLVAQRYAKAILMNLDKKDYKLFREDIDTLNKVFSKNREYISALNSFLYPLNERIDLSEKISAKLSNKGVWKNLFQLLIKKHRFSIILEVLNGLERNILAAEGKIKATLTTAYEHDEKIINKIIQMLEEKLDCKMEVILKVDPAIIGGFVAETDTLRIDGSVYNSLVKLNQLSSKQN